ncbi:MAG: hypothetical protein JXB00_12075 [Bacteroidales bacterium]|nr:hypothetical protein [Bacteroidales bacterium]
MMIELNEELYRKLAKLVYIGEWVVNSHRANEEDYEFTDIEQHIYSYSEKFGCNDIIEYDEEHDMYLPTKDMDDQVMDFIDEFLDTNKGDFIGFN